MLTELNLGTQNPQTLFSEWLAEAKSNSQIREATAMVLATIGADLQPSTRTVLLKEHQGREFTFFTNSNSRKGRELAQHPKAAITFYWDPMFRQIHIRGTVRMTEHKVAEDYWRQRPKLSQLSQWISQQSEALPAGVRLSDLYNDAQKKFESQEVPCPPHWNGYVLTASEMEFWIGDTYRLHERYLFKADSNGVWKSQQLYP